MHIYQFGLKSILLILLLVFSFNSFSNDKLVGAAITNVEHIKEIREFSNAVLFEPKSIDSLKEYLNEADGLSIIIGVNKFFFNGQLFIDRDITELASIVNTYRRNNRVIFEFDEPFWNIRYACIKGQATSCGEVGEAFSSSKIVLNRIAAKLKESVPGSEVMHVESYFELFVQYNNTGSIPLIQHSDHIGFDCYSDINACTIPVFDKDVPHITFLSVIHEQIKKQNLHAKIILVPGGYIGRPNEENSLKTEKEIIDNVSWYLDIFDTYQDYVSGIGVFLWSDLPDSLGLRSLTLASEFVKNNFKEIK